MYKYADFRRAGYRAIDALRSAKTCAEFARFDGEDLRIVAYSETDGYFDVFGEPDGYTDVHGRYHSADDERAEIIAQIERDGCWIVCCQMRGPDCDSEDAEWTTVDSVGMCTGYADPTDPIQNCYVPDLMRAGLNALAVYSI